MLLPMGLFSKPVPLEPEIADAMSKFWADGQNTYDDSHGRKKIGAAQTTIHARLESDELVLLVVPCYSSNLGFDSVLVITAKRALQVKGGKVLTDLAIDDLVAVRSGGHRQGYVVVTIESAAAVPFRNYGEGITPAAKKYFDATIVAPVLSASAANEIEANLSLAGFVPRSA